MIYISESFGKSQSRLVKGIQMSRVELSQSAD